ncbi:class I SAM-dependent methyltransferase [Candidatus Woesearchaeota archaeon]|nr:class I SAM-dependent methyltransferase [Candidatus Woesearchaeota archaeon]
MSLFQKIIKPLLLTKARKINEACGKYVKGKVIDIGAGRCYIAKELKEKNNVKVTCIDIDDLNLTELKLIKYGGKNIPFKDNEFDTALLAYVLHHCENQLQVLKEAKRVCKGNIIIFEDAKISFITKTMDFIFNALHNVKAPLLFRNEEEWIEIFNNLGLKTITIRRHVEKEWFYPFVEHTMFVVKK